MARLRELDSNFPGTEPLQYFREEKKLPNDITLLRAQVNQGVNLEVMHLKVGEVIPNTEDEAQTLRSLRIIPQDGFPVVYYRISLSMLNPNDRSAFLAAVVNYKDGIKETRHYHDDRTVMRLDNPIFTMASEGVKVDRPNYRTPKTKLVRMFWQEKKNDPKADLVDSAIAVALWWRSGVSKDLDKIAELVTYYHGYPSWGTELMDSTEEFIDDAYSAEPVFKTRDIA